MLLEHLAQCSTLSFLPRVHFLQFQWLAHNMLLRGVASSLSCIRRLGIGISTPFRHRPETYLRLLALAMEYIWSGFGGQWRLSWGRQWLRVDWVCCARRRLAARLEDLWTGRPSDRRGHGRRHVLCCKMTLLQLSRLGFAGPLLGL